jgi:hypothetical protein
MLLVVQTEDFQNHKIEPIMIVTPPPSMEALLSVHPAESVGLMGSFEYDV